MGQPVQAELLEDAGAIRARSKLTGLSHTICSKEAVSSKAACFSHTVRPWLSRLRSRLGARAPGTRRGSAQLPLARMGDAIGQRREQVVQAQPFQSADGIRGQVQHHQDARGGWTGG